MIGVAPAAKKTNLISIYSSDFEAGVDGWVNYEDGDADGPVTVGEVNNTLEVTKGAGLNACGILKANILTDPGIYRIRFRAFIPVNNALNSIAITDGLEVKYWGKVSPASNEWIWYDTLFLNRTGDTDIIILGTADGDLDFDGENESFNVNDITIYKV